MTKDNFSEIDHLARAKMDRPVGVDGLIKSLGIRLIKKELQDRQSGMLKHENDGTFSIYINSKEGPQRQRFTAAHELGHYFMHKDLIKRGQQHADRLFGGGVNPKGPLDEEHERQANQFAAETLMPRNEIKRLYSSGVDHNSLAQEFAVSAKAMAWRLVNLRLATKQEVGL